MAFKKGHAWGLVSKQEGRDRAKRRHVCLDCRYHQPKTFKNCPECGSTNRQYFMSEAEHKRGMILMTKQMAGTITRLRFQPKFDLIVNGIVIGKYIADSDYYEDGKYCVEDVKGSLRHTDNLSKWKIKHFEAQYKLKIRIEEKDGKKRTFIEKNFI